MKNITSTGSEDTRTHLGGALSLKIKKLLTKQGLIFLLILGAFFSPQEFVGQTSAAFDLPDNCKAKDLEPVSAELTGLPPCIDCDGQESWQATLSLKINNTTGSERTSFAFWAKMETTDGSGMTTTLYVYGCDGPVLPGINPLEFDELVFYEESNPTEPIEFDLIYQCGSTLKLTDMVMAWTPASSKGNQCPIIGSNIPSKCGSLGEIQINTPVTGVADVVDVSCYGGTDGSINITPSGGVPPYTFYWSMSEDSTFSSIEEDLSGIGAGTYSVVITDSTRPDFCDFTLGPIIVEEPAVLAATVNYEGVSCYGGNQGSITLSDPSGGSGSYEFSVDGTTWQEELVYAGLSSGIYDVYIRDADAKDCVILLEDDLEIEEPAILAATVDYQDISCYEGSDGSITISAPTGGSGSYEFSIDGTTWQEELIFADLRAGFYNVYIRDADAIACVILLEENLEIKAPAILAATVTSVDVSCYEGSDGSITLSSPSGGSGSYEFSIGGTIWQKGLVFAGLSAGYYDVYIRDAEATDCVIVIASNFQIDEPVVLAATVTGVDVSCYGGTDGSITVSSPTGGSGNYQVSIDGIHWQNELIFNNLSADTFDVWIRDAEFPNCSISLGSQIINQPEVLHAHFGSSDVTCYGNSDGIITFSNPTGGSGNYEYSINGGSSWQSENIFTGLAPGEYPVSVKDAATEVCFVDQGFLYIYQPNELVATVASVTDATCSGSVNGAIDITVTGGTAPYIYVWSTGVATEDLKGISVGLYSVEITDNNGCMVELTAIEVADPSDLVAVVEDTSNVSCYGSTDGAVDITVSGGTAPYSFEWSNDAETEDLDNVAAGTYSVTITDANSCSTTLSGIVITQPTPLMVDVTVEDVSCHGYNDGIITLTITGGTAPYTSEWGDSDGNGIIVLENLNEGEYHVIVADANNCALAIDGIVVEQPDQLASPVYVVTQPGCDTPYGSFEITSSIEGISLHLVLIEGDALLIIDDFDQLGAGNYELSVRNEEGCYAKSISFVINEPLNVPDTPEILMPPIECFAETGSLAITSETENLEFRIDSGAWFTYFGPVDVAPGPHAIVVRDAETLCESVPLEFAISPLPVSPVTPVVEAIQPTCEVSTGTIIVNSRIEGYQFFVGLVEDLQFIDPLFVDYPTGGFDGLVPGEYAVFAMSADGCGSGMANITLYAAENCQVAEGCTLGYWKNHTDRWCGEYQTCTVYGEVFEKAPSTLAGMTLLEVLNLGGGGINNLGRQSVAALLNACSNEVDYEIDTKSDVISYVNANFLNAGTAGSYLDELNNAGCPLGGSPATTEPSQGCDTDDSDTGNNGNNGNNSKPGKKGDISASDFTAYPVPFKETLNIQYEFDYVSPVTIQFYDLRGKLLRSVKEQKASRGVVTTIEIDFSMRANQIYIVRVTTNREVITKQINSAK